MRTALYVVILVVFTGVFTAQTGKAVRKTDPQKTITTKAKTMKGSQKVDLTKPITAEQIQQIKERAKNYPVEPVTENDIAVMETTKGTMKIRFFPDVAPKHCENFKRLANSGFYDGTLFHRVIPGFMIQGGDILSRDANRANDGTGGPGWTVPAEFNKKRHVKGILSMARSNDPNSAGSQFFICADRAAHLDGKYTVFGEVIENKDVIDAIVNVPKDKRDNPLEPVRILKVRVITPEASKDAGKK